MMKRQSTSEEKCRLSKLPRTLDEYWSVYRPFDGGQLDDEGETGHHNDIDQPARRTAMRSNRTHNMHEVKLCLVVLYFSCPGVV